MGIEQRPVLITERTYNGWRTDKRLMIRRCASRKNKGKFTNNIRDEIQSEEAGEADLLIEHAKQANHGAESYIGYNNPVSLMRLE